MSQKITPNIWFDKNAEEAVNLYKTIFPDFKIGRTTRYGKEGFEHHQMPEGTVLTIEFSINGEQFVGLNGGPVFQLNPSVSFMISCNSKEEAQGYYDKLGEGGKTLMPLQQYPWSPYYGWVDDKFGVSWQIYTNDEPAETQKVTPTLMFTGKNLGKAEEAINLYTSLFPNSSIEGILRFNGGEMEGVTSDMIQHAQFNISGYTLAAMDGPGEHKFDFNEGVSLIVDCDGQEEVDKYWNKLTADGGQESMCGWCKDKFGMSWQIVPKQLVELMTNKETAHAATMAMFKMKKIIIADLEAAVAK